jgi:hypothetical protein
MSNAGQSRGRFVLARRLKKGGGRHRKRRQPIGDGLNLGERYLHGISERQHRHHLRHHQRTQRLPSRRPLGVQTRPRPRKLSDLTSLYSTPTVDTTTSVIDTDPAGPPTIAGTVANQPTTSEAPVKPFSGVTVADADSGATDTLTITRRLWRNAYRRGPQRRHRRGLYVAGDRRHDYQRTRGSFLRADCRRVEHELDHDIQARRSQHRPSNGNTTTSVVDKDGGLPVPNRTDVAVQKQLTDEVDYLQFTGTTLIGSALQLWSGKRLEDCSLLIQQRSGRPEQIYGLCGYPNAQCERQRWFAGLTWSLMIWRRGFSCGRTLLRRPP